MVRTMETNDLALATTLRACGFEPDGLELDGQKAYWTFTGDGELHRTIRAYHAGDCLIEPRRYNRFLRQTRRQLFDFLKAQGIKPRQRRA